MSTLFADAPGGCTTHEVKYRLIYGGTRCLTPHVFRGAGQDVSRVVRIEITTLFPVRRTHVGDLLLV